MVKTEARILGLDDGPFDKFRDKDVLVVGTFFRGGSAIDGVLSTRVEVDGSDATDKIIELVNRSKFKPQLQAIMLDGICFGGFNVIDIIKFHRKTGIPVIVVMRDYPETMKMREIMKRLGKEDKITLLDQAGEIHKVNNIHVQIKGMDLDTAREMLRLTCVNSNIPEPLRVAHIIAAGIVNGESRGKP